MACVCVPTFRPCRLCPAELKYLLNEGKRGISNILFATNRIKISETVDWLLAKAITCTNMHTQVLVLLLLSSSFVFFPMIISRCFHKTYTSAHTHTHKMVHSPSNANNTCTRTHAFTKNKQRKKIYLMEKRRKERKSARNSRFFTVYIGCRIQQQQQQQ